jgi:hypothetical protein
MWRTRGYCSSDPYPFTCLAGVILPWVYAPASIALQVIRARKPAHDVNVVIKGRGSCILASRYKCCVRLTVYARRATRKWCIVSNSLGNEVVAGLFLFLHTLNAPSAFIRDVTVGSAIRTSECCGPLMVCQALAKFVREEGHPIQASKNINPTPPEDQQKNTEEYSHCVKIKS